jgi:hypothetical protein
VLDLAAVCLWCLLALVVVSLAACVCPVAAALAADLVLLCWSLALLRAAKAATLSSAWVAAVLAVVAA